MKEVVKKVLKTIGYDIHKLPQRGNDRALYSLHYGDESLNRRAFYNVSSGGHFGFGGNFDHPFWTNIDVDLGDAISPRYNPDRDIAHDPLNLGDIPLEDDSAELFYSRFALEHISDEAADKLLREFHRTLKPQGVVKIVVPNFRLDYEAYLRQDRSYFRWENVFSSDEIMKTMGFSQPLNQVSLPQLMLAHFAANASTIHADGSGSPIEDDEFDHIMRNNDFETAMTLCTSRCCVEKQKKYRKNHINWWSHEKLRNYLSEAGFSRIVFLSPGQSITPVMRDNSYFDNLWNEVALYVEAVK